VKTPSCGQAGSVSICVFSFDPAQAHLFQTGMQPAHRHYYMLVK
jgi:hypothetical protein